MEKMKLLIKDYKDEKGQTSGKRYTKFQTQKGWMNAFDKDIIDPLKELEGKWALCGVFTDDHGSKIREFHGECEPDDAATNVRPTRDEDIVSPEYVDRPKLMGHSMKDCSIVSQCLTKCVCEVMKTSAEGDEKAWTVARKAVMKSYKDFYTQLSNE